jgi:hypothetical protein
MSRNQIDTQVPLMAQSTHPERVVYFATGTVAEVAADLTRLGLSNNGTRLRVVAAAKMATQLAATVPLRHGKVLPFHAPVSPLLWLRLVAFLGFSRNVEVLCLSSSQRFGLLKFVALMLRGRVVFSPLHGERVTLSISDLVRIWFRQKLDAREGSRKHLPVGVIGSAWDASLQRIVQALRLRYPNVEIHGLLLAQSEPATRELFDSVRVLEPGVRGLLRAGADLVGSGKKYQRWVVPFTSESYGWLKLAAFLWPLGRREIYNEFADSFRARKLHRMWGHFRWRMSHEVREAGRMHLAVGVLGSASGYYLAMIVSVVRSRYPRARVHGLVLRSATPSTVALFDSVEVVTPGLLSYAGHALRLWRSRKSYQRWIVPCTNEPYTFLKFTAFLWPLRRRQIYNELGDGFPVRNWRILVGHVRWRLRDRMSFQIVAGSVGQSIPARTMHLCLYALRILGGVPLLLQARLRAACWRPWSGNRPGSVIGDRRPRGDGRNGKFFARKDRLARGGAVAPQFPGEPGGSVGLK